MLAYMYCRFGHAYISYCTVPRLFSIPRIIQLRAPMRKYNTNTIHGLNETQSYEPFLAFFHSFFFTDAAVLLPNRKDDVCLSAPVFFDIRGGPWNRI